MGSETESKESDNYNYEDDYGDDNERTTEMPTLDKLFDTKGHLKAIEKQFKGYVEENSQWKKVSDELARDAFIDKMINGLRAVINEMNIYTYLSEAQAEEILLEENIKFIKAVLNERTVDAQDLRIMVDIYDHSLQTFMGLPTKGHGSLVLREIVAGLSSGVEHLKNKSSGVLGEIGNFFKMGGK